MNIKRFFITPDPEIYERPELCWQDEYGTWTVPRSDSQNSVAQGFVPSPSDAAGKPHPEAAPRIIFSDYLVQGENGESIEVLAINDPVVIEAFRCWSSGRYDELPPGDIPMPVPGIWTFTWGQRGERIRDA